MKRTFSPNEQDSKRTKYSDQQSSKNYAFSHLSNSKNNGLNETSNQDSYLNVTKSIWNYFTSNYQTTDCYKKKLELKEALKYMFNDIFPYLGVYIVGSSANGFGNLSSDMDICLMVSHEELNQKTEALLLLKALAKAMRKAYFIKNLNVIAAKVPIIKFHDNHNKIDCDINLNNHIGIRNTHLLKAYSDIDWRVKPLVLSIKRWAKFHDINDASQKTISSYSLVLMTIYYLQSVCKPPIVPVLQKIEPEKFNVTSDITKLRLNDCHINWTSDNTRSLGELFVGFLDFYSKFNFTDYIISIRTGELIPKDCLSLEESENNKSSYIKIEEPFDLSNTARSVFDIYSFNEIKTVFKKSAQNITNQKTFESIMRVPYADFDNYDRW